MTIARNLRERIITVAEGDVKWDCPLAPYTSFGIGGPADALIVVESVAELGRLLKCFAENDLAWRFIGRGSNLLVSDGGFAGVVLLFGKELSEIEDLTEPGAESIRIRVGAGCSLAKLLNWCTERGYSGLEFAAGIPGSVGGAVVMNAGAMGEEIAGVVAALDVMSSAAGVETLNRDELEFTYRLWANQGDAEKKRIVVSVDLSLVPETKVSVQKRCRENVQMRKEKQPRIEKNAGSFFKNPNGDSAGRLIEASGLKGRCCGGAMISPVHANFIVNTGTATAGDVCQLMDIVTEQVEKDSGIHLFPEVHFL
ncbi:UDP-N-acetylmuramate dehydrogenase [Desulfocapsa sulfexigens DSM 10523]|uniref:UDP-N-acetylenolpyruvoylglucosamine reductase n=1 Tax=Desulfocapsa sulfexigens (strain DSM 10523 / SB164P1) TaxID=1167006 RepID=M1PKH0_DESSD|nr:UDP-N-acetylmuramate dehydrogenase [Desulfocapsa sulfexigens]AGF80000.1 UDP-N-acetylmuramate dehydrogenase [Desulfocapsa sulfexigens DSM 10523]